MSPVLRAGGPSYALLFRDYLRHDPAVAATYALIKHNLAEIAYGNFDAYYAVKDPVCDLVMAFKDNPRTKRLLFTYSNTCVARAGMKFTEFKQKLKNEFTSTGCTKQTISFHKKRLSDATVEATYLRQLLVFKE